MGQESRCFIIKIVKADINCECVKELNCKIHISVKKQAVSLLFCYFCYYTVITISSFCT